MITVLIDKNEMQKETRPVVCSDLFGGGTCKNLQVQNMFHKAFMVHLLLGYSLNLKTWASGVLQHTHTPGGCA